VYHSTLYPSLLVTDEHSRVNPDALYEDQPFVRPQAGLSARQYMARVFREMGHWSQAASPEQTAHALGYITAARVLPALVDIQSGRELLDYAVVLRQRLDAEMVAELAMTLRARAFALHWEQVGAHSYGAAIGSGVAVIIEITAGAERLYLRYASSLAEDLYNAHGAVELPRSQLFLQSALYERFDTLLDEVRRRTWMWLYG
jgi:hypothetical protein